MVIFMLIIDIRMVVLINGFEKMKDGYRLWMLHQHVSVFSSIFMRIYIVQCLVTIEFIKKWSNGIATIVAGTGVQGSELDMLNNGATRGEANGQLPISFFDLPIITFKWKVLPNEISSVRFESWIQLKFQLSIEIIFFNWNFNFQLSTLASIEISTFNFQLSIFNFQFSTLVSIEIEIFNFQF